MAYTTALIDSGRPASSIEPKMIIARANSLSKLLILGSSKSPITSPFLHEPVAQSWEWSHHRTCLVHVWPLAPSHHLPQWCSVTVLSTLCPLSHNEQTILENRTTTKWITLAITHAPARTHTEVNLTFYAIEAFTEWVKAAEGLSKKMFLSYR